MRLLFFIALGLGLLYLLYDNFDNPTLRAAEAAIDRYVPATSNQVVVISKLGLPSNVASKLAKRSTGPAVVVVEDKDFTSARISEIAAQYGRTAIGLRMQVAMAADYASVTVTRIENGGTIAPQLLRVNYNSQKDSWAAA